LIIKLISKVVVSEMAKEVFLMRRRKYISWIKKIIDLNETWLKAKVRIMEMLISYYYFAFWLMWIFLCPSKKKNTLIEHRKVASSNLNLYTLHSPLLVEMNTNGDAPPLEVKDRKTQRKTYFIWGLFTTLSVSQTIEYRFVRWLVKNEFKRVRKETYIA
jgi:hypothetical protein